MKYTRKPSQKSKRHFTTLKNSDTNSTFMPHHKKEKLRLVLKSTIQKQGEVISLHLQPIKTRRGEKRFLANITSWCLNWSSGS